MSLTNAAILRIAMEQSAIDANCSPADFAREESVIVPSAADPRARSYLELPFSCALISYGHNVVASIQEEYRSAVSHYLAHTSPAHCFETPNLHVLNHALEQKGQRLCFMAEYFLPDLTLLSPLSCPYPLRLLGPEDLGKLYLPEWSNALCEKRKALDILAVGAYDGGKLIGLAGCSADCQTMWQIGIDVLPPYRKQGVAACLTSRLAREALARGKVPFYCAAWSNLPSVRNALRCGFRPAWVELTAKPFAVVDELNRPFTLAFPSSPLFPGEKSDIMDHIP